MRTDAEHAEHLAALRTRASHTNRGRQLEDLLDLVHRRYARQGLAYVQRNGVPFVPKKRRPGDKGPPIGTVGPEAPPDYTVVAERHVFLVDAKSTLEARWAFSNLERHQALAFDELEFQGGVAGLVVALDHMRVVGWVPWSTLRERWWLWKQRTGRAAPGLASLGATDLEPCHGGDWLPHALGEARRRAVSRRGTAC